MVRYCKIIPHYYRSDGRFKDLDLDKIRVYTIDKQSACIEADWRGAAHPGRYDSAEEHYLFYDPIIRTLGKGFCWISLDNIELEDLKENEDALFALRSDRDAF